VVRLRLVTCEPRRDLMSDNHRIRSKRSGHGIAAF
jgi:hypothetical protein